MQVRINEARHHDLSNNIDFSAAFVATLRANDPIPADGNIRGDDLA